MPKRILKKLERYMDQWWYAPLLGFIAGADLFLLVIPTDVMLVAAVAVAPRRWLKISFFIALGSSVGATVLAYFLEKHGLPFLMHVAPEITHSHAWKFSEQLVAKHGDWAVWLIALSPFIQHPMIALAAIGKMSLEKIFIFVFAGRFPKYALIAYLTARASDTLQKESPKKT